MRAPTCRLTRGLRASRPSGVYGTNGLDNSSWSACLASNAARRRLSGGDAFRVERDALMRARRRLSALARKITTLRLRALNDLAVTDDCGAYRAPIQWTSRCPSGPRAPPGKRRSALDPHWTERRGRGLASEIVRAANRVLRSIRNEIYAVLSPPRESCPSCPLECGSYRYVSHIRVRP
jgi:hypothetical protein